MYRKVTLRRMPPVTRKYARLLNELDSVLRRGKNMVVEIQRLELDSRALANARERGALRVYPTQTKKQSQKEN